MRRRSKISAESYLIGECAMSVDDKGRDVEEIYTLIIAAQIPAVTPDTKGPTIFLQDPERVETKAVVN